MAKKDPYAALRIKEFNLFLVVRFCLVFAWAMQFTVIEWHVYELTGDPIYLGIIGLMEIIPAVATALFAGHVVDNSEKRNLLAYCIVAFAIVSALLFIMTIPSVMKLLSTSYQLIGIYILVFFGGIIRAFIGPTVFAFLGQLVPKAIYPNAATWSSSVWQMSNVIGASIAGLSIYYFGIHNSLAFVTSFCVLAIIILMQISRKPILNSRKGEPIMDSLKAGLNFVFKTKAVFGAITLDMVAVLFGGAIALLPVFVTDILQLNEREFGFLRAAPGIGAILTMLVTAFLPFAKNAGKKLLLAIFGFGVCIIVFGLSTSFWVSLIALFFSGITDGISVVIRSTILQLKTPDEMRGRVSSVNSIFVGSSNELGAFESGATAKLMGPVVAVVFGGTMTLLTVITTAVVSPSFRKLDLSADIEESEKQK